MSLWMIAVALVIGLAIAFLVYRYRERRSDVMAGLFIVAVAGLAVVVTAVRVQQYRDEQAKANAATEALTASAGPAPAAAPGVAGPPALTNGPPVQPVNVPVLAPTVRGPTGYAAPPAAENPYAGAAAR